MSSQISANTKIDTINILSELPSLNNNDLLMVQRELKTYKIKSQNINLDDSQIGFSNAQLAATNISDAIDEILSSSLQGIPIGAIIPFAQNNAPNGWLLCDGSPYSKTTYAGLFGVIGTTYGDSGDTFNVPNLKGKVPVGFNQFDTPFSQIGNTGGEQSVILTTSQMPTHSHKIAYNNGTGTGTTDAFVVYRGDRDEPNKEFNNTGESRFIETAGSGSAHNNMQPYIVFKYFIKAYSTVVNTGEIDIADLSSDILALEQRIEDLEGDDSKFKFTPGNGDNSVVGQGSATFPGGFTIKYGTAYTYSGRYNLTTFTTPFATKCQCVVTMLQTNTTYFSDTYHAAGTDYLGPWDKNGVYIRNSAHDNRYVSWIAIGY